MVAGFAMRSKSAPLMYPEWSADAMQMSGDGGYALAAG
jgi:hypothetical protein